MHTLSSNIIFCETIQKYSTLDFSLPFSRFWPNICATRTALLTSVSLCPLFPCHSYLVPHAVLAASYSGSCPKTGKHLVGQNGTNLVAQPPPTVLRTPLKIPGETQMTPRLINSENLLFSGLIILDTTVGGIPSSMHSVPHSISPTLVLIMHVRLSPEDLRHT